MSPRFLLKTVLYLCALATGFFLFASSAFAASGSDDSRPECNYLKSYLSVYRNNDPVEMRKLQLFLKEHEGFEIKLSGIFDSSTIIAVRKFQTRYSEDILAPWGLKSPTGNVSITTRHKINDLSCGITTPLSDTEKEIIQNYGVYDTAVDTIDTSTDNIVDDEDHKKEPPASTIITPTVTIEPLFENHDADNADSFLHPGFNILNIINQDKILKEVSTSADEMLHEGSEEKTEPTASTSIGGISRNNSTENGGIAGISVGFISRFSLPILIVLTALLLTQLYFFWKTAINRKLRWATRKF